MQAASADPLFDDWSARLEDPNKVTSRSARLVAARAQSLVEDWGIAAALVRSILLATHGAKGLRFRSHFQSDDEPETDETERTARRLIEASIRARPDIDASGTMTRRKLERMQDWYAVVMGDGYLVRVDQGVSRWRLVHPFRVRNPKGRTNDERWQDGHEFGADGRPVALWVDANRASDLSLPASDPVRIPWASPDGTRNVSHRKRWDIPGSVRGLSSFAPLMLPARMLQGVSEAYVAAKRVQAQIPLIMKVPDVEKAREQYRGSRLANLLSGPNSDITVLPWKFEGADYQAFTDTELRSMCAALGIPWELVLNDHSAKSGASARSMWQSFYQQADEWQLDHAEQTSRVIDEDIVRARQISDPIPGLTDDWNRNMAGVYQGPARIMPDPLKEAQAADTWDRLNRSRSSAFADQGWDYREESLQKSQDDDLDEAQGAKPEPDKPTDDPAPADPAETDQADPEDDQPETSPEQASAMAVTTDQGEDVNREEFLAGLKAMADANRENMRELKDAMMMQAVSRPQSVIHTDMRAEAIKEVLALMPPPVIQVTAAQQPAPTIHVDVPQAQAPQVTVNVPQQAAPVVMAAAAPAPVVHVHVPESKPRKQRAVEQKDGSVILEDIA